MFALPIVTVLSSVYWAFLARYDSVDGMKFDEEVLEPAADAVNAWGELHNRMMPKPKKMTPADDDMPTEEEAEESYQQTLYELACQHVGEMTEATRQRFFAHIGIAEAAPGKGRRPRRAKPEDPANGYIRELLEFHCDYDNRFRAWLPTAQLSEDDKEALIDRLQFCGNGLVLLSQELMVEPESTAIAPVDEAAA
jgi:hypothetical protein